MITIRNLHKNYRKTEALRGVSLTVPAGKVTAFLGPNGAGKTTTIQCAMNLLDRGSGSIEVLGTDPRRFTPDHWRRIGYVSENQRLPGWMTVISLLDYVRPMYGDRWDREFERKLLSDFDMPLKTRLGSLSRGQRMKAALLSAVAFRPQLVVLDEPFSGLDPLTRDEFLSGLLELTGTEGWTVWVSSHDIEEVERLADRVIMLNDGKVRLEDDVDALRERFRAVELVVAGDAVPPPVLPNAWVDLQTRPHGVSFVDTDYDEHRSQVQCRELFPDLTRHEARVMTLREIFVALARHQRHAKEVAK